MYNRNMEEYIAPDNGDVQNEVNDTPTMSRRDFLKKTGRVAGALTLAYLLSACGAEGVLKDTEQDSGMDENVGELNSQFQSRIGEFVQENRLFDYSRYSNMYPEFEKNIPAIERYAHEINKFYDIHPGVMMALASSIIVANVDRESNPNVERKYQRLGPMGMIPNTVLPVVNKSFNEKYTDDYLEHPENSIYFAMIYMAETLKDIKNDGENKDMMSLMLANYYGGNLLQDIAKGRNSIENNQGLKDSYNLYTKTLSVLNAQVVSTEQATVDPEIEPELRQVLIKAESMWSKSKFGEFASVFAQQANDYIKEARLFNPEVTKSELLAVFIAVARAESMGGIYKKIENPPPDLNWEDLALGWYQIVPKWQHLERFNADKGKNYTYQDMVDNDKASIEAGIWTLMQYSHAMDLPELMRKFKGGWNFGDMVKQPDDTLWWNRVSYGIKSLLGYNPFEMQYLNYLYPKQVRDENGKVIKVVWEGPFYGSEFEQSEHVGVMKPDVQEEV
jgi:hypothetical protein